MEQRKLDDIDDNGWHHDKNKGSHHAQAICQQTFFQHQETFCVSFKAVEEEPPGGNREIDLVSHLQNLWEAELTEQNN